MDPADPHRFILTDDEADALVSKGFDPVKVKCVIVALRARIGDKTVSTLFHRGSEEQENLNMVRQLRRGEISSDGIVIVGDLFNNPHQWEKDHNFPSSVLWGQLLTITSIFKDHGYIQFITDLSERCPLTRGTIRIKKIFLSLTVTARIVMVASTFQF